MARRVRESGGVARVKSRSEKTVQFEVEKIMLSSNSASAKKIILYFPLHLLERTDNAAHLLHTDRSKLIREAVEEKVRHLERERLALELREGYIANADLDSRICREFEAADFEALQSTDR